MAQVPAGKNRSGQLSKQTGDAWETQARRWLESQGLRFIAANARERGGEIDLIMRDGAVVGSRADNVVTLTDFDMAKPVLQTLLVKNQGIDDRVKYLSFATPRLKNQSLKTRTLLILPNC